MLWLMLSTVIEVVAMCNDRSDETKMDIEVDKITRVFDLAYQ